MFFLNKDLMLICPQTQTWMRKPVYKLHIADLNFQALKEIKHSCELWPNVMEKENNSKNHHWCPLFLSSRAIITHFEKELTRLVITFGRIPRIHVPRVGQTTTCHLFWKGISNNKTSKKLQTRKQGSSSSSSDFDICGKYQVVVTWGKCELIVQYGFRNLEKDGFFVHVLALFWKCADNFNAYVPPFYQVSFCFVELFCCMPMLRCNVILIWTTDFWDWMISTQMSRRNHKI